MCRGGLLEEEREVVTYDAPPPSLSCTCPVVVVFSSARSDAPSSSFCWLLQPMYITA